MHTSCHRLLVNVIKNVNKDKSLWSEMLARMLYIVVMIANVNKREMDMMRG